MVLKGTQPDSLIEAEPFRLDTDSSSKPSRFVFELLINEDIYKLSFSVTWKAVLEEKLALLTSAGEKVLYDRRDGKPNFEKSLAKDEFLKFAFQGTRDNQLFLTNSVFQNADHFRPVYNWFKNNLELVAPDSRFEPFEQFLDKNNPLYSTMNEMLPRLDTGIAHIDGLDIPIENIPIPDSVLTSLHEDVKEGKTVRLKNIPINESFVLTRKNGQLNAKALVAYHRKSDGTEAPFEIREEADGTQRLIDLLPAFLDLTSPNSERVYIIDEFDRSLHTLLTRNLLEAYLAACSPETRSQLLLTTHDVLLMDQQLLRRDEMWVTERDDTGASSLISFAEYKDIRYDKDVRKSYLQGRLGGIPRIFVGNILER